MNKRSRTHGVSLYLSLIRFSFFFFVNYMQGNRNVEQSLCMVKRNKRAISLRDILIISTHVPVNGWLHLSLLKKTLINISSFITRLENHLKKKDFFFISIPFVYNMIFMRLEFLIWMLFTIRISQKVWISDLFQLIVYLYSLYNNHSLHESYRNKAVTQIFMFPEPTK